MEITARPHRRGWLRALKVALGAACLVSVALLVPPALGYGTHVVGDDAMGRAVPRGALVFDEPLTRGRAEVGDVVALRPPGGSDLVVRRVVSVDDDGVRTAGDVTGEDPWVVEGTAVERVALTVPWLGWPLLAVDSMSVPPWAPAAVAAGMAALLLGLRRAGRGGHDTRTPAGPAGGERTVEARPAPPAG